MVPVRESIMLFQLKLCHFLIGDLLTVTICTDAIFVPSKLVPIENQFIHIIHRNDRLSIQTAVAADWLSILSIRSTP